MRRELQLLVVAPRSRVPLGRNSPGGTCKRHVDQHLSTLLLIGLFFFIFSCRSFELKVLLAETSTGADIGATAAFRPLMPRSLRGGGGRVLAKPAVATRPGGIGVEGAGNGAAERVRYEERAAGAGSGDTNGDGDEGGGGGGGGSGGGENCRQVYGCDRRNEDGPKVKENAAPSELPGSGTSSDMNGSAVGATNYDPDVQRGGAAGSARTSEGKLAPFNSGDILDTPKGVDGATAATAATAAVAAAAGVVADPADAKVLSGCAVSFRREDFVVEEHGDHRYDVVCLFSVVKWMHLNGGDEAVRNVFRKAYGLLRPGGRLILEPQVGIVCTCSKLATMVRSA